MIAPVGAALIALWMVGYCPGTRSVVRAEIAGSPPATPYTPISIAPMARMGAQYRRVLDLGCAPEADMVTPCRRHAKGAYTGPVEGERGGWERRGPGGSTCPYAAEASRKRSSSPAERRSTGS